MPLKKGKKKIWEQKKCLVFDHTQTLLLGGFDSIPSSIVYYVSLSKLITLYKPQFPHLYNEEITPALLDGHFVR